MATKKTTKKKKLRRLTLSRYQISIIRGLRQDLGTTIRDVYYENMFELLRVAREDLADWTLQETDYAMEQANKLIDMVTLYRKAVKSLVDGKPLPQMVDQVTYDLLSVLPGEPTRRQLAGARRRAIGLLVGMPEQYKKRLKDFVAYANRALVHFRRIAKDLDVMPPTEATSLYVINFLKGMDALRNAWEKLYYTVQARDIRQFKLSPDESADWHESLRKSGHPPQPLVREFFVQAEDQGVYVHVYDDLNDLVFTAWPATGTIGEREYAQRAAAARPTAKVAWEYRRGQEGLPGASFAPYVPVEEREELEDPAVLLQSMLTKEQQREVSKILEEEGPQPVAELARRVGAPYYGMARVEQEQRMAEGGEPSGEFHFNLGGYQPNPRELSPEEVRQLHIDIWSMDLGLPEGF